MKEFANAVAIRCHHYEKDDIKSLMNSVGYTFDKDCTFDNRCWVITYLNGRSAFHTHSGSSDNLIIDYFDKDLIRDIVSVCSNETWQKDEPTVYHFRGDFIYSSPDGDNSLCNVRNHPFHSYRRPTVAEICNHYGYHLEGNNIVKNVEKPTLEERVAKLEEVVNSTKPCCERVENNVMLVTDDGYYIRANDLYYKIYWNYSIEPYTYNPYGNTLPSDIVIARFKNKKAAEEYVRKNKPFEPVDVVITCNSPEELRGLWHVLNQSNHVVERLFGGDSNIGEYKLETKNWFKVVNELLIKLNLKK